jgi:putative ABC transport system substrate-binding protein
MIFGKFVRPSCRNISKVFALMLLMVPWVLVSTNVQARGNVVAIISSQDSLPYQLSVQGLEGELKNRKLAGEILRFQLDGSEEQEQYIIETIRKRGAKMVFTFGYTATHIATQQFSDRPIVAGLIYHTGSLGNSPNATGVILQHSALTQLQWLQKFLPEAKSIGIIYSPAENKAWALSAGMMAQALNVELIGAEVASPTDLPTALKMISRRVDVLWGVPDRVISSPQAMKAVLLASFRNRIPVVGPSPEWVKAGALYSLDWDYTDMGSQCADIAARLFKGVPINAIPPLRPRKLIYSINLKTAAHMQIKIPQKLIEGAHFLIEPSEEKKK